MPRGRRGLGFASPLHVDIVALLDRCIALERGAGEVYVILAERFRTDAELHALWTAMAADEGEHAHKLATWRGLAAAEPKEHRESASGFSEAIDALAALIDRARADAARCETPDQAFAVALALETSELDTVYTTLLQASPIARFPDMAETMRHESGAHHAPLVRTVQGRSRDEHNLLRAALLAADAKR